tara:strand:+ start:108 stop:413 length:306 start_codon:yes stop_codon:yes gene_type:complete
MKKLLLVLVLAISTISLMSLTKNIEIEEVKTEVVEFESDYDKGWEAGWCEGWKDVKGQYAYCPYTPYPPYPKYECSEGYKCGYNRGFKYGMCKAKERDCEK